MSETTKWTVEFTAEADVVHADGTTNEEGKS